MSITGLAVLPVGDAAVGLGDAEIGERRAETETFEQCCVMLNAANVV